MNKKSQQPSKKQQKEKSSIRDNVEMILEVLVYVFFINAFLLQTFGIPTSSMEDNMLIGDHLLVDKIAYSRSLGTLDGFMFPQLDMKRGLTVVFKSPPEVKRNNMSRLMYVKRVIALPGETIMVKENQVYINSNPLHEPYVSFKGNPSVPDNFPPENLSDWWPEFPLEHRYNLVETELGMAYQVPEDHYFCMGDNRNISADSRVWGPLHQDYLIGKPWRNYWSFDAPTEHYLNKNLFQRIGYTIINFFKHTRWERTLKKY